MKDQEWKELVTLLRTRINAGLGGKTSARSVHEILDEELAAEYPVKLSEEESRRHLAALERPFSPNAKLKKAMDRGLSRREK